MATVSSSTELARNAERIYAERLKETLEAMHRGQFVAIEPQSGDHYLGRTLSEAIGVARQAHPDRLVYALRVGEETAVHIGRCAL
jgi:hypothetical protein